MAEAGDPQGDVIPSDPITTSESVIPFLKGSEELEKSLPQPKDLQKHSSEVPCLEKNQEDASHIKAKPCVPGMQCVLDSKQGRPHSIAEVHISDGVVGVQKGDGVNHRNEHPLFFMQKSFSLQKDLKGDKLDSSKLPAEKSCSEILESEKESPAISPLCESSGPVCAGKDQKRPARPLVCKQAMQLQQSNTVTTFCRASSSSLSSPTQQGCARVCNSSPVQALKESGGEMKHSMFAETVCCGAHFHGPFEDTFAAYCHPQPIPAPAQLLPRLTGMEEECNSRGQIGGPVLLSLPPLISSVSETGLDAKRVLRCCHLDCNWPGPLHHPGCQQLAVEVRKSTREAGTMTSCQELRDMGVQVGQTELEKPPQHVFPEVCLVEDKTNGSDKPVPSQKTPVKEVKWDAEGMTWEVYGASVDPEELGLAIQKHLELQIKEAAGRGSKISRENTSMSQTSIQKEQPKRKRGVIAALRRPGCCARTTTAVD